MKINMKQLTFDASGKAIIDTTFVVLDCETTGLNPKSDAITELAAIKICGGETVGSFHSLINPLRPLPARISMLTGITQDQLKDCPTFEELAPTFLEFLGDSIVVGHNVKFDINFLNSGLERANFPILSNAFLDTLSMAKKIIPREVPNFKLSTLAQYCRSESSPTHRAYADVEATIEVFHYLIERSSSIGIAGLNDLFTIPGLQKRERFLKKDLSIDAPKLPGVYMFVSSDDEILYVGTSKNIKKRLYSYFVSDDRSRISKMLTRASRIEYITTPTQFEARVAELRLLQALAPEYNVADVRPSRMNYVVADPNELAPTFRVKPKQSDAGLIQYGPFTSRKIAESFCEALQYVFRLRTCSNSCQRGKKAVTSQCLNSIRGVHSCFCFDDFENIEEYQTNFSEIAMKFDKDFSTFSARLISEMNLHSENLNFEKAQKIHQYAITIQKWMNRLSTITFASRVSTEESLEIPEIIRGIPIVRHTPMQNSSSTSKALKIIEDGNNQSFLSESEIENKNDFYVSNKSEFRERYYAANFLARNSFRTKRLNKETQMTVETDHRKIKATTIL